MAASKTMRLSPIVLTPEEPGDKTVLWIDSSAPERPVAKAPYNGGFVSIIGEKGDKGDRGDTGPSISVNIGTVAQTEIGTSPTVTKTQVGTVVTLNFTFPMYDISTASKAQLESDLKAYIDGLFAAQATALAEWKAGVISDLNDWKVEVVGEIAQYKTNITNALEDNERVIANALVRHELELSD